MHHVPMGEPVVSIWDKVSAVATAGATIVALALPFLLQWLKKRSDRRSFISAVDEILRGVEDALIAYNVAYALTDSWSAEDTSSRTEKIRNIEERALRATHVLDHLMKRSDLTDAIIRCGVDGRALGEETAKAISGAYSTSLSPRLDAMQALQFNHTRAMRALDQVIRLRKKYGLRISKRLAAIGEQWRTGKLVDPEADFDDDRD